MIAIIVGGVVAVAGITVLVGALVALTSGESAASVDVAEELAERTGEAVGRAVGNLLEAGDAHDLHVDSDHD